VTPTELEMALGELLMAEAPDLVPALLADELAWQAEVDRVSGVTVVFVIRKSDGAMLFEATSEVPDDA
jgi:hypothetical protein